MIIAEESSSPIKYSFNDVPSIILSYSVFALEAIIAAQHHCTPFFASRDSIGMQLDFAIIAQRSTVSYLLWACVVNKNHTQIMFKMAVPRALLK